MKPTSKAKEIDNLLKELFGVDRRESIINGTCIAPPTGCGKPIGKFKNELSKKEYTISGLCQDCQNKIFGE
jgi:hypothetical protein